MVDLIGRHARTPAEERVLHEEVAHLDTHEAQTHGIVGLFYKLYITETINFVRNKGGRVLDIGSGEGMIFKDSGLRPIQLDISPTRLQRAKQYNSLLVCADAYAMPFKDEVFDIVLLVAMLEHVSTPKDVLTEAQRVLRGGGHSVIVVPNDLNMSLGRLLLRKWPPRYPDHLTFFTPARLAHWARDASLAVISGFPMPFRSLSFWLNMYYFAILEKRPTPT
jgi:SAM-dependent methyltransferase